MNATTAPGHPLDKVIWNALTTVQAGWSRGNALARRFRREFACFAAMPVLAPAGFEALAADMGEDEFVALFEAGDIDAGPCFDVIDRKNLVQMVGAASEAVRAPGRFRPLRTPDAPAMTALATATAPGPWFQRTAELGRFFGFESDGRLVAMAGERMRVPGHTEISAVCCHPDWRGRGLAGDLVRLVAQGIVARGETPFLHVLEANTRAIQLYENLGLLQRRRLRLTVLRRR